MIRKTHSKREGLSKAMVFKVFSLESKFLKINDTRNHRFKRKSSESFQVTKKRGEKREREVEKGFTEKENR